MTRAMVDLDYPPKKFEKMLFVIAEDHDVHLLHGLDPATLRYINMAASSYQLNFLRVRDIAEISVDDAREWIKAQPIPERKTPRE